LPNSRSRSLRGALVGLILVLAPLQALDRRRPWRCCAQGACQAPRHVIASVVRETDAFAAGAKPHHDMTLLVIRASA